MYHDKSRNTTYFDSPAEMAAQCSANGWRYSSNIEWLGGLDHAEIGRRMTVGDDSMVAQARKMVDKFANDIDLSMPTMDMDVCGAFPLVPAHLSGDPESFYCLGESRSSAAPLNILVDGTCSAGIGADVMRKRGVAILALVMAVSASRPITLELANVLDCGPEHIRNGDNVSFVRTRIETAPLDLATAAFCLTCVGVARGLAYAVHRHVWGAPLMWQGLRGLDARNTRDPRVMARTKELMGVEQTDLLIPSAHLHDPIVDKPEQWLAETYAACVSSINDAAYA